MTYFEVLVEGTSDVPTLREVLQRKFGLVEGENFRIHPHRGKGRLPENVNQAPALRHQGLLDQLPAKLRGFGRYLDASACVLVVIDADDTPCHELLEGLNRMLAQLPSKPARVLFRVAIEETESWFIADDAAVAKAFPKAKLAKLRQIQPDAVCGAWEVLAVALGFRLADVTGIDKTEWARAIAPHLDLDHPRSPSLGKLLAGVQREMTRACV